MRHRESNWYRRGIKEAIEIAKNNPSMNSDNGRYHLSAVWDRVLKNQSGNDIAMEIASGANEAK